MSSLHAEPRRYVLAAAGHEVNESQWHPDHGVKLLHWDAGGEMQAMLFAWEDAQRAMGLEMSDQRALMHAVAAAPAARHFSFGRLPRSLSCRIRPGFGESFAMEWDDRRFSM
jgi:predicted cupin superfamily sugar epimerase